MIVECVDNSGFEDQLTNGTEYTVKLIGNGAAEMQIENDDQVERWYGSSKFRVQL